MIKRENRLVRTVYSREEYNCMQMESAIDRMYGGKLSNFLAAFVKKNTINKKEAEELRKILEDR